MKQMAALDVIGVGLSCPGHASVSSWLTAHRPDFARLEAPGAATAGAGATGSNLSDASGRGPGAGLLSVRMRGRASVLTRIFADVTDQAAAQAGADVGRLPMIHGSAFGEMATTLRLLESMHTGDGRLSPAQFQASVHNTAAGQISISQGNRAFTTSLAAGRDTLAMCFLEAWSWLAEHGGQVLVACADEPIPPVFEPSDVYEPLGAAFLLDASLSHRAPLARLTRPMAGPPGGETSIPGLPAQHESHPCGPALGLLSALFAAQPSQVSLNPHADSSWSVGVRPLSAPRGAP